MIHAGGADPKLDCVSRDEVLDSLRSEIRRDCRVEDRDDPTTFFDEVRSDRSWVLAVVIPATVAVAAVGGFLLHASLAQAAKPLLLRLLVGGVIGTGFLMGFGAVSIILTRRLLRPPVRVRIDAWGVRVGARGTSWTEIRKVQCMVRGGGTVICFRTARRLDWIRVPGHLSSAKAGRLLDDLGEFFEGSGFQIEIKVK